MFGVRAALAVVCLALLLLGIFLAGGVTGWWPVTADMDALVNMGMIFLFLTLGCLILWKANGNRVGWAFSAIGLSMLCAAIAGGLGRRWSGGGRGGRRSVLALLDPRARPRRPLVSHRSGPDTAVEWLEWLGFFLVAITFISYTFADQICVDSDGVCLEWVDNPIGIPGMPNPEFGWLAGPLLSFYPVFMGAVVLSLFLRFRRARAVERLQLKWFLLACGSTVLAFITELVFEGAGVTDPPLWLDVWISLSLLSIPIAATIAILRYRLYEIDRIISRTVSYALVVGILGCRLPGSAHLAHLVAPRPVAAGGGRRHPGSGLPLQPGADGGSRPGWTGASTAPGMTLRESWTASPSHSAIRPTAKR